MKPLVALGLAPGLALGLALAAPSPAMARVSDAQACRGAKLAAAGRAERCLLRADSLIARTSRLSDDAARRVARVAVCLDDLDKAYRDADAAWPGVCPAGDDADALRRCAQDVGTAVGRASGPTRPAGQAQACESTRLRDSARAAQVILGAEARFEKSPGSASDSDRRDAARGVAAARLADSFAATAAKADGLCPSSKGDSAVVETLVSCIAGLMAGEETSDVALPASTVCTPAADRCAAAPSSAGPFAVQRKDAWLPESDYDEVGIRPLAGGRFQVAALSAVTGDVTGLELRGIDADTLLGEVDRLEWYQVWPRRVVAGEPVWVAFHTRDPAWDALSSASILLRTTGGDAIDGEFPVARTPVPLTYVTTADGGATLLVHAHNDDTSPHALTRLLVNGRDVTSSGIACIADPVVAPGASALWVVPLCEPLGPGAPWTVVAEYADAPAAVGAGRVVPERFMIETWPNSTECSWPGDFAIHREAGFDTFFTRWGRHCGTTGQSAVNSGLLEDEGVQALLTHDFLSKPDPGGAITRTGGLAGLFIGDEVDGEIWRDGKNLAAENASETRALWDLYPGMPVYQGSKTNKNVGSYAGLTDVQGADFYVAACAPHITKFGKHPPLRGAFDYLRNARNNHMPLPTWLYAQGISKAWNRISILTGEFVRVQPDPQEIVLQGVSALAAGAKGLMWFQTVRSEWEAAPERWQAITQVNRVARAVRPLLREGDPTGMARTTAPALVEAIRSREAIVVTVIADSAWQAPTDFSCAATYIGRPVPHWRLDWQSVSVDVDVPTDFPVAEVFEVRPDGTAGIREASADGRTVTLGGIALDDRRAARVFVLARTPEVRAQVEAALP